MLFPTNNTNIEGGGGEGLNTISITYKIPLINELNIKAKTRSLKNQVGCLIHLKYFYK